MKVTMPKRLITNEFFAPYVGENFNPDMDCCAVGYLALKIGGVERREWSPELFNECYEAVADAVGCERYEVGNLASGNNAALFDEARLEFFRDWCTRHGVEVVEREAA